MTNHTPGPWFVCNNEIHGGPTQIMVQEPGAKWWEKDCPQTIETVDRIMVAAVQGYVSDEEFYANQSLITAAPDLLAALVLARPFVEGKNCKVESAIRSAIDKARNL